MISQAIITQSLNGIWCIDKAAFSQRVADIELRMAADGLLSKRPQPSSRAAFQIAVIPLRGVIQGRSNWLSELFGDTSLDSFCAMLDMAVSDPSVKGILIDADTPGGSVYGVPEAAAKLYAARGKKPIVAVANSMTASAGYYIASAADRVYVTPSGEVGSIGVYSIHMDCSVALAKEGVKVTITKAGKYKAEGNPYEPLGTDAAAYEQKQVDSVYTDFVNAVAKHRGTTPGKVRADFGQGRTVQAQQAVQLGMADRVATFGDVLMRLAEDRIDTRGPSAADKWLDRSRMTAGELDFQFRKQRFESRAKARQHEIEMERIRRQRPDYLA